MGTTYRDLAEGRQYEILVRVRGVSRVEREKRAFELNVEDTQGTRFPLIVWEKSEAGRDFDWQQGHWYRLSGVSVNEWPSGKVLHGTSALEIEDLGSRKDDTQANILYLTDSHLGKTTHEYLGQRWSVSPVDGFRTAIEYAIENQVSAVVHGGDLFHNPGDGIQDKEVAVCREGLTKLAEHGIPFYFIYGNHERQAGRRIMGRFVDDGLATHLGPRYEVVKDTVALYGIDYTPDWDKHVLDLEQAPEGLTTILYVHQSMAPFTASANPECSLQGVQEASNIPLDSVVTGHTHSRSEQHRGSHGLAGGATARLGETKDELEPSVELVSIEGDEMTIQQEYL